jgi:hypothetical protein
MSTFLFRNILPVNVNIETKTPEEDIIDVLKEVTQW